MIDFISLPTCFPRCLTSLRPLFCKQQLASQNLLCNHIGDKMNDLNDKKVSGAREDNLTASIERQTSQFPSSTFLALAGGSIATAAVLKMAGKHDWALFVGQWAAPFLLLGIYSRLVKQLGSDAESRAGA
jgi:hypothetical protein